MVFEKNNKIWVGRKHSEETKKKMSIKRLGTKMSLETKRKLSELAKNRIGIKNSNYGKRHVFSDEARKNMSDAHIGIFVGRKISEKQKLQISKKNKGRLIGEKSPHWKGGNKLMIARRNHKRKEKGFIPIILRNPYNELIDYHHIHPDLPYVILVPRRVHLFFNGKDINHFDNVNAMVGIKFDIPNIIKHIDLEGDICQD